MTTAPLQALSNFGAATSLADLPDGVRSAVRRHLLDTLGVGLAGSAQPEPMIVALTVDDSGGPGVIWGQRRRVSPRSAALINAVAAHALDFDDTNGLDHSGAVVVPATLAAVASRPVPTTGAAVMVAVAVGYDVGKRVLDACGGYEAHNGAGWHSTGTCGTLAAAAAASVIFDLAPGEVANALGIAASCSSGLWGFAHDGAMTKRLHAGRAAEAGLYAAQLAARGFTGPSAVFDARWGGFFATFAPAVSRPGCLTEGLGTNWRILESSIKPYASCRGTHSAIDALDRLLRDLDVPWPEVERLVVTTSRFLADMCAGRDTSTVTGAQLSLAYALATYLVTGRMGAEALTSERRNADEVQSAMRRIEIVVDERLDADAQPLVQVTTRDGRRRECCVVHALGSPQNRLSDGHVTAKFEELAQKVLTQAQTRRVAQFVSNLEELPDAEEINTSLAASTAAVNVARSKRIESLGAQNRATRMP